VGVEVNGPVITQTLIQRFESGGMTLEEFIEALKANNQVVYDYLLMLDEAVHNNDVLPWHVVKASSEARRKPGQFIVKK
jgi:hypothetical protein